MKSQLICSFVADDAYTTEKLQELYFFFFVTKIKLVNRRFYKKDKRRYGCGKKIGRNSKKIGLRIGND